MKKKTDDKTLQQCIFYELKYGRFKDSWVSIGELREWLKENGFSYNYELIMRIIFLLMYKNIVEIARDVVWDKRYIYTSVKIAKGAMLET